MGFVGSASTLSLTAKMTPYGKSLLLSQPASAIIKKFSLGDSDANYYTSVALTTGQVPEISGDYNTNGDKIYNTGFAPTLNSNSVALLSAANVPSAIATISAPTNIASVPPASTGV